MHDVIIIGAGPAGLSAAIYGVRAGLDLLVLEKFAPGGQVMTTYEVENYPGFTDPVAGWDLMARMEAQARRLGARIESSEVMGIERDGAAGSFRLRQSGGPDLEGRTVIIASGAAFRRLNVPGEQEFTGRGVSYCATCDGAFFRDKEVAVVGGGDVALEEAHFLTRFASRVHLIHRRNEFRGTKILQERVRECGRVGFIYDTVVDEVKGTDKVRGVTLRNVRTDERSELGVDGVFIFVGNDPNTAFVPVEVLNDRSEVIVDMQMRTSIPGLFGAGDLREGSRRQIVMAAADGATAVLSAFDYLTGKDDPSCRP